jgi:hypothetical protein
MKCEIELSWRSADETLTLSRGKDNDEQWVSPLEGAKASVVPQIIGVLDATYADIRAALLATLPKEMQEHISIVVKMTPEQARSFMADGR